MSSSPVGRSSHLPTDVTGTPKKIQAALAEPEKPRDLGGLLDYAGGVGRSDETPPGRLADHAQDDTPATVTQSGPEIDSLLAAVAAAPSRDPVALGPTLREGDLVDGSYRIGRLLGRGGMGTVFLAKDLELDRFVALKVHRGAVRKQEVVRLSREARVMARLSHPNVVAVYEVGTHEGVLFVVMEYVDGGTLRQWLTSAERSWRDVVQLVLAVAQGIVAAHAIGVVHRDLKPENVLIGADGRARVADFGLARWQEATRTTLASPSGEDDEAASSDARSDDLERFTVTGAIAGTPAYMSPEQFAGIEVGPASDQFSLCVMLYEALYGRRPFQGRTTLQLANAVIEGELQAPPARSDVPRALTHAILRGLARDPADRHASVAALCSALQRVLGQRRRRIFAGVAGTLLVAASIGGFSAATAITPELCEDADAPLDSVWNDERREVVRDALASTDVALADAVVERIDAHAQEWGLRRRAACEDSRVTGERSDLEHGLRTACLDRMLARLDGLVLELADGGPAGDLDAPTLGTMLPDLALCDDIDALERTTNRFASRSARDSTAQDRAWADAGRLLTRATARLHLGRSDYEPLAEQAMTLGRDNELPEVELSAVLLLAEAAKERGDSEVADAYFARAASLAAITGDDEGALEVMLSRAQAAIAQHRLDEATVHMQYFADYLPRASARQGAESLRRRGKIAQGHLALARGEHKRAIAMIEPTIAELAADALERGPALHALGAAYFTAGRMQDARDVFAQLLVREEARIGPNAVVVGKIHNDLGVTQTNLGEHDAAAESLQRAFDIATRAGAEGAELRAIVIENRGSSALIRGDLEEAEARLREALQLRTDALGEQHPALAAILEELGETMRRRGRPDEALEHLERAMGLYDAALGPGNAPVATTLTRMGLVFLAQDRAETAERALRAALQIREAKDADPVRWAETEAALAQVIAARDPLEAEALRSSALARVRDVGSYAAPVLASLE
jgi:tetratricopeptide (TPR) repeat protein/predicted Ser/Thr protein kinase